MAFGGCELRFHPKESHFPMDYHRYVGTTNHLGKTYHYESYRWTYAINNGIGCCFLFPKSRAMGYHAGDNEGVVILMDETNVPQKVYFHAHGQGQGMWCDWDECQKTDTGALVVYVARYSHASYPKATVYVRGFGFANDVTSNDGKRIAYAPPLAISTSLVTRQLPSQSITPFLRFTLPLFMDKIRSL